MVKRTFARITLALSPALALLAGPSHGAEGDSCRRARSVLGDEFKDATEERCQQALDIADEDRWQLWLDVATAAELSGDLDRAALTLDRFVRDADRRGRLPSHWATIRDEARTSISRLDAQVLKTKARVTLVTVPEGADVEIVGTPRRPNAERTPTNRYFAPGNHTVRVSLDANQSREVAFSVEAGQTVELKIDLRPTAPKDLAVTESRAPSMLGAAPSVEVVKVATGPNPADPKATGTTTTTTPADASSSANAQPTTTPIEPRPLLDPDDPPLVSPETGTWTKVGRVAITLGGASLAAGVVFVLQGAGLDDEAACSGLACEVDGPLRERVKDEAGIAWRRAAGALIVGALLVGGGITAIVRDTPDEPAATTTISPWLSPDGAGISGAVRF